MLIVRRNLTQDPEIEASRNLPELVNGMTATDKESFIGTFDEWYEKYKDVVNERVRDGRIKRKTPPYMRPRLRGAYLSVNRNMPLLWTFYDHPETGLPNTNNALEGLFSDLKTNVRVHSESAANTGKSCWTNTSKDIIDTGTAAEIYDRRRLKFKHCAEPVGEAGSVLDFCRSITQKVQVAHVEQTVYKINDYSSRNSSRSILVC